MGLVCVCVGQMIQNWEFWKVKYFEKYSDFIATEKIELILPWNKQKRNGERYLNFVTFAIWRILSSWKWGRSNWILSEEESRWQSLLEDGWLETPEHWKQKV